MSHFQDLDLGDLQMSALILLEHSWNYSVIEKPKHMRDHMEIVPQLIVPQVGQHHMGALCGNHLDNPRLVEHHDNYNSNHHHMEQKNHAAEYTVDA